VSRVPSFRGVKPCFANHAFHRNIWGPHRRPELVDVLGAHYKFSLRLQAIIRSSPLKDQAPSINKDKHVSRFSRPKSSQKNDPEIALSSLGSSPSSSTAPPLTRSNTARGTSHDVDHYTLADQMQNYHALDVGQHCEGPRDPLQGEC
jgi:hypothetical protein